MQNLDQKWSAACSLLQDRLSKDVYDRWISGIQPDGYADDTLTLKVANDFYHSWLEENYLPLIRNAVETVLERPTEISFSVDREVNTQDRAPVKRNSPVPRARSTKKNVAKLNPKYTFETFIVGPSNNFAHAATLAVAQSPARAYNPLFIYGGVGLGKTHLMQAIGNYALKNGKADICYISSEEFINEYIDALKRKELALFRKKYRNTDILLIDDIQFLGGKEQMQEEFFHTFNTLFDNHKQIVMTCDRPAAEIPDLEHRLVSRFEWGLVTELELPDLETRIAILQNKAEQLNIDVEPDIINCIAENIRSNIRRLEGALIRAASFASLTNCEMTVSMVEHILQDTFDQEKQKTTLSIDEIQRTVAEYYDIRITDMASKRRPASIAFPRQVAMYLARDLTNHSLPSIGESFKKNHATVLHACKLVDRRIKEDPSVRQSLTVLRQRLSKRQGV